MRAAQRARPARDRLDPADRKLADGVLAHEPRALAKTITLLESSRRDHRARAGKLLEALLPHTGRSFRIGISGAPGAGKSTFIETLGLFLTGRGHRVAVLAVDPTSALSGGSILGDKTRMERLSRDPNAFIRPSPSGGMLGGVAHMTREAMLACEAAGYDVVIVETVGVGQSETAVAGMTDCFVLVALPNAGDDLQAIKRGIVELVDVVAVNKADIDPKAAELARTQIANALSMLRPHEQVTGEGKGSPATFWTAPVVSLSALKAEGIDAFWHECERFRDTLTASGALAAKRQRQALDWMSALVEHELHARFYQHPTVRQELAAVREAVAEGSMTPAAAAAKLLNAAAG
ncbi:MAG TPA: methylmalonyl Co-A mutase-associated GTPase MeaB [Burkholderiales bacterium]|nr:methylmalonyl Co-A mutase-associated GTPase MeaB [Burkholderiales bacterium]